MADRLTKITTRGGDKGETSLGDGSRVPKTDERIALLGEVDELNSWIGVVLSHGPSQTIQTLLEDVQHDLFDLGGALCFPDAPLLSLAHVERLDKAVEQLNQDLTPLKEFILPGGSPLLSWLHIARTKARHGERSMAHFIQNQTQAEKTTSHAIPYLNRLSDILFIAARHEAKHNNIAEIYWKKEKSVQG